MASVDKVGRIYADSEMEEGEIVDELDDLSDISSEEEFLLRQRLEVLENYNNVLERKKKKHTSGSKLIHDLSWDLSEISAAEIEEPKLCSTKHADKTQKHVKQYSKQRRRKELNQKSFEVKQIKRKRDYRKKTSSTRKKLASKAISESSDESEDEYRNKRKKLADAVKGHRKISDTSSLSARLKKMLHKSEESVSMDSYITNTHTNNNNQMEVSLSLHNLETIDELDCGEIKNNDYKEYVEKQSLCEPIDLLSTDNDDDDVKLITSNDSRLPVSNNLSTQKPATEKLKALEEEKDSDEDLAELRQQVLSSKTLKAKITQKEQPETKIASDDEDSDTTELRLICLKSALLKRAIEMKQKQKLQKRLSQSTLEDDILNENILFPTKIDSGNNTDIESVDMDVESDTEEKIKDSKNDIRPKKSEMNDTKLIENHNDAIHNVRTNKEDELEEDEDLLRAKLLTSLSKNLPNLVSPEILSTIEETKVIESNVKKPVAPKVPEQKRFIIELDESDFEGEHEATKNLTKMHMKLSEQSDFQHKLDLFLKSTRMAVENPKLPDVVQNPMLPKKPEKFVAKAVNHLPKSEQIEYKNLVKRMAELEKMKQSRQSLITMASASQPSSKDTLRPRNAINDISLEEKISISRKKIADESAKMLKLKEEATKLSQKYKIVATELHNISTAITLNKKQQRAVQNCLSKIRQQHQSLLKSSTTSLRSKVNSHFSNLTNNVANTTKVQKENNPRNDYKNPLVQKSVKVSIVNDLNYEKTKNQRISIEFNVANNQKVVKLPSPVKERLVEITKSTENQVLNTVDRNNEATKIVEIEAKERVIDINKKVEKEVLNRLEGVIHGTESTEVMHRLAQDVQVIKIIEKERTNKLETGVKESSEIKVQRLEQQTEATNTIVKEITQSESLNTTFEKSRRNSIPDDDKHSTKDYDSKRFAVSDYKSPLEAFGTMLWESDPNAILCPFEVGGQCKDPDCKYLHTELSKQ